ncbi:fumarylacetoacetate hydrolase [Roseateles asaccharophilus]|uniref:Fumarylacetoacetate (FAA) hydrolase n=1 Tax=Roseateles asaccharophilus TaxID=582607 RepID=A0ABU2A7H7_9BURK|nr:fumarylacetoacetate hydrolase [Roseateles asaccharophilus]MDR7333156.1 fumarylacetoacetate (FAA) hydrolase [Roseateles asaccharophilus]
MKLASYADGSRDGHLVVVSRDLTQAHYASGIATRLQQVLDDWGFIAPQLQDLAVQLNHGKLRHAFPFEPEKCMAPLPRPHGWAVVGADGSVRREAGQLLGAGMPLRAAAACEPALMAIAGDLHAASDTAAALDALRLLGLAVDWRLDSELLATHAAPLLVTPDELGEAWTGVRLQARLVALHNGSKLEPRDVVAAPADALVRLTRLRAQRTGQLAGVALGALDVALAPGDSLRLDLKSTDGQTSLFGAIDLDLTPPAA